MPSISSEGGKRDSYQPLAAGMPDATTAGDGTALPTHTSLESDAEIDAYMARLLDRVNQRSSQSGPPPAAVAPPTPPTSPDTPPGVADGKATVLPRPSSDRPPADDPREPADPEAPAATNPRERTVPSEHARDLSALRDLANCSAQVAIETYSSKRLHREARSKLIVAVAVGTAAGLLLRLAGNSFLLRAQALVAATVGVVYGSQAIGLWWHARTAGRKARGWNEPGTAPEIPPAADDK